MSPRCGGPTARPISDELATDIGDRISLRVRRGDGGQPAAPRIARAPSRGRFQGCHQARAGADSDDRRAGAGSADRLGAHLLRHAGVRGAATRRSPGACGQDSRELRSGGDGSARHAARDRRCRCRSHLAQPGGRNRGTSFPRGPGPGRGPVRRDRRLSDRLPNFRSLRKAVRCTCSRTWSIRDG